MKPNVIYTIRHGGNVLMMRNNMAEAIFTVTLGMGCDCGKMVMFLICNSFDCLASHLVGSSPTQGERLNEARFSR